MSTMTSEDAFLACIDRHFSNTHPHVLRGRGDDCCELSCPSRMTLSTDLFMQDAHFRLSYFSASDIGHKALAVNISDIAAAGATPLGFSLGLMIPDGTTGAQHFADSYWDDLFAGMAALADTFNVALTGGDLTRAGTFGLCVTVWGGPHYDAPFLRRSGCKAGDALFLVGQTEYAPAGLARTGLLELEARGASAADCYPEAVQAHLRPVPLVHAGQCLAAFQQQHSDARIALMDLSDGLARDLPRLLAAGKGTTGASLILPDAMLHPEVRRWATANGHNAAMHAFSGGEDYALLGSCAPEAVNGLTTALEKTGHRLTLLGTAHGDGGILLNGVPVTAKGFDHFSA
ncbi:thiamine-phosphate kinase [Oleidesulfovibrio sp.]|uniref:thiamine-phosphate kinase n=1 Tax=Oleidesulfovibrio sp. TaxID=2909707 RepID=UPI003A8B6C00